jgi:hypothetical protein
VYQAVDNPNDITVTHEFSTVEAAQAFVKSEELKQAMQNAGVVGAPTIWFTNKVQDIVFRPDHRGNPINIAECGT